MDFAFFDLFRAIRAPLWRGPYTAYSHSIARIRKSFLSAMVGHLCAASRLEIPFCPCQWVRISRLIICTIQTRTRSTWLHTYLARSLVCAHPCKSLFYFSFPVNSVWPHLLRIACRCPRSRRIQFMQLIKAFAADAFCNYPSTSYSICGAIYLLKDYLTFYFSTNKPFHKNLARNNQNCNSSGSQQQWKAKKIGKRITIICIEFLISSRHFRHQFF